MVTVLAFLVTGCGASASAPGDAANLADHAGGGGQPDSGSGAEGGTSGTTDAASGSPDDAAIDMATDDGFVDLRDHDGPAEGGPSDATLADTATDAGSTDAGGREGGVSGRCTPVRLGPTRHTRDAKIADVDGDGLADIVTAEVDGHTSVFRQTVARTFADPDVYNMGTLYEEAVAPIDLNEDGVLDFAASDGYGRIGLLLSAPTGGRAFSTVYMSTQTILFQIAIADFDGDGHNDIAVPAYELGTLGMLWSTGPGTFLPWTSQAICREPTSVVVLDANEDGRPDLLVGCYTGAVQLLLGSGARSFTATPGFFNISSTVVVATGDVNGDGHTDFVVPDRSHKQLVVMLGDGTGQFSQPTGLVATTQTELASAAVADFDDDGKADVMVGRIDDQHVFFYKGTGDGHFRAPQSMSTDWTAINLSAGDVDGDGVPDLVATNWGRGATIYFGPCP